MAARHVSPLLAIALAFTLNLLLIPAPAALAQFGADADEEAPDVPNSKHQFLGEINANAVMVRCGPSNNFYPTMKLDKGARVTAVAMVHDWLKILPPKGSFSYVSSAFVQRFGDGTRGQVTEPIKARAGSLLTELKTTVQTKLTVGQNVKILGEQDEYFKIEPPEGAYLYVSARHVTLLGKDPAPGQPGASPTPKQGAEEIAAKPKSDEPAVAEKPLADAATSPETQPASTDLADGEIEPQSRPVAANADAATRPTTPTAESVAQDLARLEGEFAAATPKPVLEQPIDQLTERYTSLLRTSALTRQQKQIVEARLMALKYRAEAREKLAAFQEGQRQLRDRQAALEVEREEIGERIKQSQVSFYSAVGVLRVSSLQQGSGTLYRLTDPATGRTVVYVRTNEPKYASLLNRFVGVRGDLTNDERLKMKIITPKEAEAVDQAKVASGNVIATITPPSMISAPAEAAADVRETGN